LQATLAREASIFGRRQKKIVRVNSQTAVVVPGGN
jgi:hypothetical protein